MQISIKATFTSHRNDQLTNAWEGKHESVVN